MHSNTYAAAIRKSPLVSNYYYPSNTHTGFWGHPPTPCTIFAQTFPIPHSPFPIINYPFQKYYRRGLSFSQQALIRQLEHLRLSSPTHTLRVIIDDPTGSHTNILRHYLKYLNNLSPFPSLILSDTPKKQLSPIPGITQLSSRQTISALRGLTPHANILLLNAHLQKPSLPHHRAWLHTAIQHLAPYLPPQNAAIIIVGSTATPSYFRTLYRSPSLFTAYTRLTTLKNLKRPTPLHPLKCPKSPNSPNSLNDIIPPKPTHHHRRPPIPHLKTLP